MADAYSELAKWSETAQAQAMAKREKRKAWQRFFFEYPEADKEKFEAEVEIPKKGVENASINYKEADGGLLDVFISDKKYWPEEMKKALGLKKNPGFPQVLRENPAVALNVPAIDFNKAAPSLQKVFAKKIKIFATSSDYFKTSFRQIFEQLQIAHTTAAESKKWLAGPEMSYWPQQLNFAVWCATMGCGVSRDLFDDDNAKTSLPESVRSFYLFHVYFTIRRVLFEMGGIQRIMSLPGDPNFDQKNNKYDIASYKRLCAEFGIKPTTDFRYKHGANGGLGNVWIWVTNVGPQKTYAAYPGYDKCPDEGGTAEAGNAINKILNDIAHQQPNHFCPTVSNGLTAAGLSRINQSIEAFVYCVLGAQVNVRSSIIGEGGRAKEAQEEFLVLMEQAITEIDMRKPVSRYQLVVDKAMVRLNFAVCPGAWLMPGSMIINTEAVIGYNNALKQAGNGVKLGINNNINISTKISSSLKPMEGREDKVNKNIVKKISTPPSSPTQTEPTTASRQTDYHNQNKTATIVGVLTIAAFLFLTLR